MYIAGKLHQIFCVCYLYVTVARSFSGGVAIRHVSLLPVLRATSYLHIFAKNRRQGKDVYLELLAMWQHGLAYTQTDSTAGSIGLGAESDVYDVRSCGQYNRWLDRQSDRV